MTKEELKQEAQEYYEDETEGTFQICEDCYWFADAVQTAYVDSAEPREKRIAELERKLEQTEKDLADYQFNYPTIKELEKENAELKQLIKTQDRKLRQQSEECDKAINRVEILAKENAELKSEKGCETCTKFDEVQLSKAKEIIKKLCIRQDDYCIDCTCYKFLENMRAEAEQFLSEVEKWE